MDGERELTRSAARVARSGERGMSLHDRRAPVNLRAVGHQWRPQPQRSLSRLTNSAPIAGIGLRACQCIAIVGAAVVIESAGRLGGDPTAFAHHALIALTTAAVFVSIVVSMGAFRSDPGAGLLRLPVKSLVLLSLAGLAAVGGYKIFANWPSGSPSDQAFGHWISAWFLTASAAVAALDIAAGALTERWAKQGRLAKKIVVYGSGEHGARFISDAVDRWNDRVSVQGYFDDRMDGRRNAIAGVPFLGDADRLARYACETGVEEIVIALPWSADERILAILAKFRHLPVPVRLAPELIALRTHGAGLTIGAADSIPMIRDRPISEWDLFVKEAFDRAMAAILLLLALPTMAVLAGLIKWDSPGPVFFRQRRLGFNSRPFEILKFRTMASSSDERLALRQARRGDGRITRVGNFLRRSSLDELPQLINVLRGDMSLIGPRPHPMWTRAGELWPDQGDRPLEAILCEYASRHRVKPGITGWAQVRGCRGETDTIDKMARRVEHDLYYIENWSIGLDLKILFLTLVTVILADDAR